MHEVGKLYYAAYKQSETPLKPYPLKKVITIENLEHQLGEEHFRNGSKNLHNST